MNLASGCKNMSNELEKILDKLVEDIVDANFNGYNYELYGPAKIAIEQLILDARIEELRIILRSPDAHDWAGQMANAVGTVARRYNKLTKLRHQNNS